VTPVGFKPTTAGAEKHIDKILIEKADRLVI